MDIHRLRLFLGGPWIRRWGWLLALPFALLLGLAIGTGNKLPLMLFFLPPILMFMAYFYANPKVGMYFVLVISFMQAGLTRYYPFAPYGLGVDVFLLLPILFTILGKGRELDASDLHQAVFYVILIWFGYCVIEIANPLSRSVVAWFYAMRGLALYLVLNFICGVLIFNKPKDMDMMITIWTIFSIIGTIWGIKQLFIGVSPTEQRWLDAGAANTHVLFGKLRVFSYYSDAAQFGASQAMAGIVFGIFSIAEWENKRRRNYLIFSSLMAFYGMLISGSRGPLVIPALAGFMYLLLSKRVKILILGCSIGFFMFAVLKWTTIGQTNYQINRMRTAMNPSEDPSFMVRKNREKILENYMHNKPIGAGIGMAGSWGKRFAPGSFLAELGTDGHYTRVWAECGFIGLYVHVFMIVFIAVKGFMVVWNLKESNTRVKLIAMYGGYCGVAVASYTNGLITQIPTAPLTYFGIAFIFLGPRWERDEEKRQKALEEEEKLKKKTIPID
ncbi:O-antigen ligase domain-containing protein [Persicobacter sp. CCB-QB2]|uniref:O-antigen ligase domain-containing protein n=1 Tax=Persicobacter sp. CCB-QB2 TaxID=1561025 RepID=UPI0012F77CC8|nr:O-antigen ligase domain-containing protein [Persicobacter sp. CCB-QB2]